MPTSTPAYTGAYSPMYPLSAANDPAMGMLGVCGGELPVSHPTVDAATQRRSAEYNASVESLAVAQREVAVEVEQTLLALRGRIDELLRFTQAGHSASASETAAVAAAVAAAAPPSAAMPAATTTPRRPPPIPRSDPPSTNPAMTAPMASPHRQSPHHRPSPAMDVSDAPGFGPGYDPHYAPPAVYANAPRWAVPSPRPH